MTPEEIKTQNTRIVEAMVRNSACQCKGSGVVPCLKHHRAAFEVYFFAKYNVAPFQKTADINRSGKRISNWMQLVISKRTGINFFAQEITLLRKLVLPGCVTYNGERKGWCFYGQKGQMIIASGSRLNEVSRRYAQRNKRARWPNKGFS